MESTVQYSLSRQPVFPSQTKKGWFNTNPPDSSELNWIEKFGKYPNFCAEGTSIKNRLRLEKANLKEATRIILVYHYLHRGRTMAQLPYWIYIDNVPIGVILFSYPRLSSSLFGIRPMNILELARLWISPDVQEKRIQIGNTSHALSIASCAVGKSLKILQKDWYIKYPKSPDIRAVVSWADDIHHEGIIYKAANFRSMKKSGGTLHGSTRRKGGGQDKKNADYKHIKTLWWKPYQKFLTKSQKRHIDIHHQEQKKIPRLYNNNLSLDIKEFLPERI